MNESITKRLHVSGLTPSLTPDDLSARLSNFGTVKSLDGFGLLDGVGQPRRFGYVTLETTNAALKRCFSTLSGTTYKGAKLRIGEAKPDYTARHDKAKEESEPSAKKRRVHHNKYTAVPASDMSPVTRENAAGRSGWKVMPSGRIVRTMRMRPGKPLPPLPATAKNALPSSSGKPDAKKKKKKKAKDPDNRARTRTIDVTKWDGSYVTGVFLGGEDVAKLVSSRVVDEPLSALKTKAKEKKEKEKNKKVVQDDPVRQAAPTTSSLASVSANSSNDIHSPSIPPEPSGKPSLISAAAADIAAPPPPYTTDLAAERAQTLSFLNSLFASSNSNSNSKIEDVDWESDVDLDEVDARVVPAQIAADADADTEEGYEIVPREREDAYIMDVDSHPPDADADAMPDAQVEPEQQGEDEEEDQEEDDEIQQDPSSSSHLDPSSPKSKAKPQENSNPNLSAPPPPPLKNSLKDLFAPREDEGGFSLLNHLDLDDDLDLDMVPFPTSIPAPESHTHTHTQAQITAPVVLSSAVYTRTSQSTSTQRQTHAQITLDPKKPLFFPRSIALSTASAGASGSPFYMEQTPEEIRQRWEDSKLELTRGWKKRYREAGKVRRRRGGDDDG